MQFNSSIFILISNKPLDLYFGVDKSILIFNILLFIIFTLFLDAFFIAISIFIINYIIAIYISRGNPDFFSIILLKYIFINKYPTLTLGRTWEP